MYTVALTDILLAVAILGAAFITLGAILEYLYHAVHNDHRKGRHR